IAREAEGETHLRHARGSVPPLFRSCRTDSRHYRRNSLTTSRAPSRQRGVSAWPGYVQAPGAATRPPWPFPGQREESRRAIVLRERRRCRDGDRPESAEHEHRTRDGGSEGTRHSGVVVVRRQRDQRSHRLDADSAADTHATATTPTT